MKRDERAHERLTALIEKGERVLAGKRPESGTMDSEKWVVNRQGYADWSNQAFVWLTQVFGPAHTYTKDFEWLTVADADEKSVDEGLGVLREALTDGEQGYLDNLREIAAAGGFSDSLDQADHLLENGYVAPAASLAGAVLENGLRSLAARHDIPVKGRDNLSALNNKLGEKAVYDRIRQRRVSVWTKVRDYAVHGHFDDLHESDVDDLIKGVQNFLAEQA